MKKILISIIALILLISLSVLMVSCSNGGKYNGEEDISGGEYTKKAVMLAAPKLMKDNNNNIYWNKIDKAEGYIVNVNGTDRPAQADTFFEFIREEGVYSVKVLAKGNGKEYLDSAYSEMVQYKSEQIFSVAKYDGGKCVINGKDYVLKGNDYNFTISLSDIYSGSFKVYVDDEELTAINGLYTVRNVTDNLTISIDDSDLKIYSPKINFVKNGSFEILGDNKVSFGDDYEFEVVSAGAKPIVVFLNNGILEKTSSGKYVVESVTEDLTFTVIECSGVFESVSDSRFYTNAWSTWYWDMPDNSSLSVYNGTLGGKTGEFLKFSPCAPTDPNSIYYVTGFHTSRPDDIIAYELKAMKHLGYATIETEVYAAKDETVLTMIAGTNDAKDIGDVKGGQWITFEIDIDNLIAGYTNGTIGFAYTHAPLIVSWQNKDLSPLYFTDFVYKKGLKPATETGLFESVENHRFYIDGWGSYGGTNAYSTLEVYEGTVGGETGKFLKYCPDGYIQEGFHTKRSDNIIFSELQTMRDLGYTGIRTQIYSEGVDVEGAKVGYCVPYEPGNFRDSVNLVSGEWVTFTWDINDLIDWYGRHIMGYDYPYSPFAVVWGVGPMTSGTPTTPVFFTDFVYVK